MIRLIIHVLTSARDLSGNCYHAARITRTRDGASITIKDLGGDSNARHYAANAGLDYAEIYSVQEVIPIREWNRATKEYPHMQESAITAFCSRALPRSKQPHARYVSTTWEIWTYDVWVNAEDGYEVNDRYSRSRAHVLKLKIEGNNRAGTPEYFESATPSDYALQQIFGFSGAIETDGDDLSIYVRRERDGYPLGEIHCVSHASLSPIREIPATEPQNPPQSAPSTPAT
jgi:hypothetical protein